MEKFEKNLKNKGYTLIELIISLAIGLIIGIGLVSLFLAIYKSFDEIIKRNKAIASIFNSAEILILDIKKAGYGFNSSSNSSAPFIWDNNTKTLTLKFVDYTKSGCEDKNWGNYSSCNYEITYKLENNNIERIVDEGANGTGAFASMFDEKIVEVETFEIDNSTFPLIKIKMDFKIKTSNDTYNFETYVKIPNV